MFSKLSRRGRVRVVVFTLAGFAVLSVYAFREHCQRVRLEQAVANSYLSAFSEVTASLDQMDNALRKGVYVTSAPMLCSLCDEIYAQSKAAQTALGRLPFSSVELEQTGSFVAKVGDYAYTLSMTAARTGERPEGADGRNWQKLSQAADQLSARLDELQLQLFDGTMTIESVEQAQRRLQQEQPAQGESAFQSVEAEFPETPSLIYDGPFSQHLTGKTPQMTRGQREISQEQAVRLARQLTGWEELTFSGETEGALPCYTCTSPDGSRTAQITRRGGFLAAAMSQSAPSELRLTEEEGVSAAKAVLERLDMTDMGESYWQRYDNTLTVNFCYAPEGVRCYPDLVKVSVSLEDGSLTGFEAQGYLTNHRPRKLAQPGVSEETAQESVSPLLTVIGCNLSVIPSRGEREVLCWEFLCENEAGEHVITYLNAQTGAEEKILLLMEDENGTLAV